MKTLQAEELRKRNREEQRRAYENMKASLHSSAKHSGINAVLKFLNIKGTVDERKELSEQLEYARDNYNLKTRYIELDTDWYTSAAMPMIVKTNDGDWLAVLPRSDGSCVYSDNGKMIRVTKANAGIFSGGALCFYPILKSGRNRLINLVSFIMRASTVSDRVKVLAASAAAAAAGMLLPWVNSFIFSKIIPAGVTSGILAAAALVISAVAASSILILLQSLILTNVMLRCGAYIQGAVFSRLLSLKTDFFRDRRSGEISGMAAEFADITKTVTVKSIGACIGAVMALVYLIQMSKYAPQLFWIVILISVVQTAFTVAAGIARSRQLGRYTSSIMDMSGFCYELFSGIEQVKLNGAEPRMLRRWSELYLNAARGAEVPFTAKYLPSISRFIGILGTAALFVAGAELSASNYIAFAAAYGAYAAAGGAAAVIIDMLAAFRASYTRIKPLLEAECEDDGGGRIVPDNISGDIDVTDLYFGYGKDMPSVINGITVHIKSGESIGIAGASGCGKSTLIRLLLGFEQAQSGSVYIDGYDIRELDLKSLRRKVGAVLQNTGLIMGDIYSNITLTRPHASEDEISEAVEAAGLTETIKTLPMGLHTPVSQENLHAFRRTASEGTHSAGAYFKAVYTYI